METTRQPMNKLDADTHRKIGKVCRAVTQAGYRYSSMFNDRYKGGVGTRRLKFMTYGSKTRHTYELAEITTLDACIHAILDEQDIDVVSAEWKECVTSSGEQYLAYCVVL